MIAVSMLVAAMAFVGCDRKSEKASTGVIVEGEQRIGVLLVNHGSRSATWRQALLDLETSVRDSILAEGRVAEVRTAFMEYTEPSIATCLREFDATGVGDVILVPIFLTVSSHTFDDIPTIIGAKEDPRSLELLLSEGIERYKPRAAVHILPRLDFTDLLKLNVLRRVRSMSRFPAEEGLVLIAYGDGTYEREWTALLEEVGRHVGKETGITAHQHAWCGHVVHYNPAETTRAVQRVLEVKGRALVVPVLVAHDEMFQVKIIGDGISAVPDWKERVEYRPDAILPDGNVERWILDTVRAGLGELVSGQRIGK